MKIGQVGAKLFHVGGQTDMTKLIVAFLNFANAPKKKCLAQMLGARELTYWRWLIILFLLVCSDWTYRFLFAMLGLYEE
jgi:hypothetical protein